jgi:hypothetical protein
LLGLGQVSGWVKALLKQDWVEVKVQQGNSSKPLAARVLVVMVL